MHFQELSSEDFSITGEHSVKKIEFDHITADAGQLTVIQGEEVTDWIVCGLLTSDWTQLKEFLEAGDISFQSLEEFIEQNQIQITAE